MDKFTQNALIVAGSLTAVYLTTRKPKHREMTIDEQEALATPPFNNIAIQQARPVTATSSTQFAHIYDEYIPPWLANESVGTQSSGTRNHNPHPIQKGPIEMKIASVNVKNYPDMPPKFVAADIKKMTEVASIAGLQEITPGEDSSVVKEALGANWALVGQGHETVIAYRTDNWEAFDPEFIPFSWRKDMTKVNKRSGVVGSAFRSKKRPNLPPFAVVNIHAMVGAYRHSALTLMDNPISAKRMVVWHKEFDAYRTVGSHYYQKGMSVFFTGDLNRHLCPTPIKGTHWLTAGGIDYIGILPHDNSVGIRIQSTPGGLRIPIHSDHDLRAVHGRLFAK